MRRAKVMYLQDCECDCCDEKKECATIDVGITNFVWLLCKDCLSEFLESFYSEKELRRMKLEKIKKKK